MIACIRCFVLMFLFDVFLFLLSLSLFIECTCSLNGVCVCVCVLIKLATSLAWVRFGSRRLLVHRILFAGFLYFPSSPNIVTSFLFHSRFFFSTKRGSRFTVLRLDKKKKNSSETFPTICWLWLTIKQIPWHHRTALCSNRNLLAKMLRSQPANTISIKYELDFGPETINSRENVYTNIYLNMSSITVACFTFHIRRLTEFAFSHWC